MASQHQESLRQKEAEWQKRTQDYEAENDRKYRELQSQLERESEKLVSDFEASFASLQSETKEICTKDSWQTSRTRFWSSTVNSKRDPPKKRIWK